MKRTLNHAVQSVTFMTVVLFLITSCASQIKFTSSWTNRQVKIKNSPTVMVMVLGKPNSDVRKNIEDDMVARLKKDGVNVVAATGLLQSGVKYDSAMLVSLLKKNNIDLLLTNAVVSRSENQRFIPGTVQSTEIMVPSGGAANPNIPYNNVNNGFNGYYNYYNYYNYASVANSYQTIDATPTMGTTIVDVFIVIESNLYEVGTSQLIWHGQSTSTTKDPTESEIKAFSKAVIGDINKNKLLVK
jgi:hypothetical protein